MRPLLVFLLALGVCGCGFRKLSSTNACFAYVVTSDTHTCARKTDSTLWCWGNNQYGQLGLGPDTSPVQTPALVEALQTSASRIYLPTSIGTSSARTAFSCSRRSDSSLWCWGNNELGQLGTGDNVNRDRPVQIGADTLGTNVHSVGAGAGFACTRKVDGTVWCWGQNESGQLGRGDTTARRTPEQVVSDDLNGTVTQLAAGGSHACALKADGSLWCWGKNQYGQLGLGDTRRRELPERVTTIDEVQVVFAGADHTCAARADGSLWCWGYNQYGQLGTGDQRGRSLPAQLDFADLGAGVTTVSGGATHTCAVKTDGSLWCWGGNQYGQLGTGDREASPTPMQVAFPSGNTVAQVYAGGSHTCARTSNSALWCWGANDSGQLGVGTGQGRLTPSMLAPPCP